jgi:hypothetical protein
MKHRSNETVKNALGRMVRLRHRQLLPTSFLHQDVGYSHLQCSVLALHQRVFPMPLLQQLRSRQRHIQRFENMFRNIRFISLIERKTSGR